MHTRLDLRLLREQLTIDKRPMVNESGEVLRDARGRALFEENSAGKPYTVYDTSQGAPKGFGVKVSAGNKKSFYIQVRRADRVVKAKIGDLNEFVRLDDAYARGQVFLAKIRDTGRNPNKLTRERSLGEATLAEVFAEYRIHLTTRGTPAKKNSLDALDKAVAKFSAWADRRVSEIGTAEIMKRFVEMKSRTTTTAEQTFRWASAATKYKIRNDLLEVKLGLDATPMPNPFEVLTLRKMFRDKDQLERDYAASRARNPLSLEKTVGPFLNALWDRRGLRPVGTDYLLLGLLWGCRKTEHAPLKWKERLSPTQAASDSWVDLNERKVRFFNTKNGLELELPIAPMVHKLLQMRQKEVALQADREKMGKRSVFVFPALSPRSAGGYYGSPQELLRSIRDDAGIDKLAPHDLRRTFGRVGNALGYSDLSVKELLNHRVKGGATALYTGAEWETKVERMERIEQTILAKAPRVWNALRPLDKLMPMPEEDGWQSKPLRKNRVHDHKQPGMESA